MLHLLFRVTATAEPAEGRIRILWRLALRVAVAGLPRHEGVPLASDGTAAATPRSPRRGRGTHFMGPSWFSAECPQTHWAPVLRVCPGMNQQYLCPAYSVLGPSQHVLTEPASDV
jgi:hypothetical protein